MIEALKNGESKLVLCKDFSRFFRDYVEIGAYLKRIFPFMGVHFISVNDGYDSDDYKETTGGMDVVMRYIVYSYYSRDPSQKIKTVLRSKIKHGEYIASYASYFNISRDRFADSWIILYTTDTICIPGYLLSKVEVY